MGVYVCLEIEVGWDIHFVFLSTAPRMRNRKSRYAIRGKAYDNITLKACYVDASASLCAKALI